MALKTVYAGLEFEKALVLRSLLSAHHIPCFMSNEHHASVEPSLQFALGGTSLIVPEICEQDARELIDAWPRQTSNNDLDQARDDGLLEMSWRCSRCNSEMSTKRISRVGSAIGVISFFLAGFNQPFVPNSSVITDIDALQPIILRTLK